MVFVAPSWVPSLGDLPDSITIGEFVNNERYGRHALSTSHKPYTCGLTGRTHTAEQVIQRTDHLARAIGKRLAFDIDDGTEWDRVVSLFAVNTIDYIPLCHAVHRLSGIVTPASAAFSAPELEYQLRSSGASSLFTCVPLLDTALTAAKAVGIPEDRIFLLPLPGHKGSFPYKTIEELIDEGRSLAELKPLRWTKGQGARQVAFLSYSSGTSGLPKAVQVSHYNLIANVAQITKFCDYARQHEGLGPQVIVGVLPFSHIYGLTMNALVSQYRGDGCIVLPRFELDSFLGSIQKYKIQILFIVPPILIQMLNSPDKCDKTDLSSVRYIGSGAAPLGPETVDASLAKYPQWRLGQGYGMTECSPVVTNTSELDLYPGSSGSLLPGAKAKVLDVEGKEVTEYEKRGELYVQSPAVVLGYLNNEKATAETFVWHDDGRWLRTGDEVLVRKSDKGHEHFFIVDRIKELIKVKGFQVAPAELEAHILSHPAVSDCAVIAVPDDRAGEAPKAFVVKTNSSDADDVVSKQIHEHVQEHKSQHKWLRGGIQFIDAVPKSPSGKILRRMLRDSEKEARQKKKPKL